MLGEQKQSTSRCLHHHGQRAGAADDCALVHHARSSVAAQYANHYAWHMAICTSGQVWNCKVGIALQLSAADADIQNRYMHKSCMQDCKTEEGEELNMLCT